MRSTPVNNLSITVLIVLFLITVSSSLAQPTLQKAVSEGNLKTVKHLIKAGADVNGTDTLKHTPLMIAAANGNTAIVKALLKKGASINAQNYFGETALMIAVQQNRPDVVKLLLKKGASHSLTDSKGWTALMLSVSPEVTSLLIRHKADVNYRVPEKGTTALMVAAEEGNAAIVRILLEAGADKACANAAGLKAADFALKKNHHELAELLQ